MRNRRPRRFRYRSNDRKFDVRHNNGSVAARLGAIKFSNERGRNNLKPPQNPEKLVEKYNNLAKEALSSGDKILSENYLQHADHFSRIIQARQNNNVIKNDSKVTELRVSDSNQNQNEKNTEKKE